MKKDSEKLVNAVADVQDNLNSLSVDAINEKAPCQEPEPQEKSLEEIAKSEGALYIKPKRRLSPPLGCLNDCKNPEKIKRQHARDWEYVKGVYENIAVPGEAIKFSLCLYAGDPDYLWEIPCNVPVYVPRMVARHLESVQQYHQFGHIEKPSKLQSVDEFTHELNVIGTSYRGKFRPMEAFR
jgi:hypothetical protein